MANFCQNTEPIVQSVSGFGFADAPELLTTARGDISNKSAKNSWFVIMVNRVAVSVLHNFVPVGRCFAKPSAKRIIAKQIATSPRPRHDQQRHQQVAFVEQFHPPS
jgi:hypothetical protein